MKSEKPVIERNIRIRTLFYGLSFSSLFLIIGFKLVCLQVFEGSRLSEVAANQYERTFKSTGKRGTIFDKNLREMAISIDVTSIAVHPAQVKDKKKTARLLSKALGKNFNTLYRSLQSEKPFVWIKRQVNPTEEGKVRKLGLEGVVFKSEYSRFYPNRSLASQVIGFSGIDGHGLEGVEFSYDDQLKGQVIRQTALTDALGRRIDTGEKKEIVIDGNNIVLTLDSTIQYISEKALGKVIEEFGAKSGLAVVMNPLTGALLAVAHWPQFNPNAYREYDRSLWRNRVITDSYEPGSTMKVFCAAAAIDSDVCTPDSIFFCENGKYKIGPNVVHDAGSHSFGWLSLLEIIKYSSNIGAVKIEELIGPKVLYEGLSGFGFGQKTGIDCVGETPGSLTHYRKWTRIDAGTISFGQGISASPLQLISAISAIANNGVMMKPYLVQAVTDPSGGLIKNTVPSPIRRVVSEKTAKELKKILATVSEEGGTGTNAALEGYRVCGKTGTAQKIGKDGMYARGKYMSSFIGFVPADKPAISILVVLDEPGKRYYGGTVAAPAFREIAHETLDYLNIPPENKPDIYTVALKDEIIH